MIKKFGLVELERYTNEIGFKKGDVRTIKGVLAVVDIPNVIAEEAKEAIAKAKSAIQGLAADVSNLVKLDTEDEAKTKSQVANIQVTRTSRKAVNKAEIANLNVKTSKQFSGITKLENVLKKFSK